jgi:hypothetical protein
VTGEAMGDEGGDYDVVIFWLSDELRERLRRESFERTLRQIERLPEEEEG